MPVEGHSDQQRFSPLTIGPVRDHFSTPVWEPGLLKLAENPKVRSDAENDEFPLPPAAQREGYHGDRHFEHWLSGRRDALDVTSKIRPPRERATVLEFGGATGRVSRHLPALLGPEHSYLLADVNEEHIGWVNTHLAPAIVGFQTRLSPPFPLADRSVDVAFAFSVFTHIYEFETAWLMELARVLKPGALLYVTVHEDVLWKTVKDSVLYAAIADVPEFQALQKSMPDLQGRVVFSYGRIDGIRNCNVFHSAEYIHRLWSKFFVVESIEPRKHNHQAAVVMRAKSGG